MKIISFNVNGLRSAIKKEVLPWLLEQNADIICLQEIKAQESDLPNQVCPLEGYHCFYYCAQKKGYSGVAIFCKQKPDQVHYGLGWELADNEGRFLQADFGDLSVASLYLPSGSAGEHRQTEKFKFMKHFLGNLEAMKKSHRQFILCGDWNIAHTEMDIKNWRSNQKNSGFLPEERLWLTEILKDFNLVDGFRALHPNKVQYSWWSQRGQAFAKDVGWRIDYQIISHQLAEKICSMDMPREPKFSDHAPVIAEYNL